MNTTALPILGFIDFSRNYFADILTKDTFGNLTSVKTLHLGYNKITSIANDTFDVIGTNLEHLNLRGNLFTTLPERIFQSLLFHKISIILFGNRWHCLCDLLWLQQLIQKKPSPVLSPLPHCTSPRNYKSKAIDQVELCNSMTMTTDGSETTSLLSGDSVTTAKQPGDTPSNVVALNCKIADGNAIGEIKFTKQQKLLSIVENINGGFIAHVKSFSWKYILIWYKNELPFQMQSVERMDCVTGNEDEDEEEQAVVGANMVTVNATLEKGHTYIFCLALKQSLSISPLDCVSYYQIT